MTINLTFSFLGPHFDKMVEYDFRILVLNKIIQQYPFLILYTQER